MSWHWRNTKSGVLVLHRHRSFSLALDNYNCATERRVSIVPLTEWNWASFISPSAPHRLIHTPGQMVSEGQWRPHSVRLNAKLNRGPLTIRKWRLIGQNTFWNNSQINNHTFLFSIPYNMYPLLGGRNPLCLWWFGEEDEVGEGCHGMSFQIQNATQNQMTSWFSEKLCSFKGVLSPKDVTVLAPTPLRIRTAVVLWKLASSQMK